MPKYAQKPAKAAHPLSAEALGVPAEIYSADEAGVGIPRARAARRSRGGLRYILIEVYNMDVNFAIARPLCLHRDAPSLAK